MVRVMYASVRMGMSDGKISSWQNSTTEHKWEKNDAAYILLKSLKAQSNKRSRIACKIRREDEKPIGNAENWERDYLNQ